VRSGCSAKRKAVTSRLWPAPALLVRTHVFALWHLFAGVASRAWPPFSLRPLSFCRVPPVSIPLLSRCTRNMFVKSIRSRCFSDTSRSYGEILGREQFHFPFFATRSCMYDVVEKNVIFARTIVRGSLTSFAEKHAIVSVKFFNWLYIDYIYSLWNVFVVDTHRYANYIYWYIALAILILKGPIGCPRVPILCGDVHFFADFYFLCPRLWCSDRMDFSWISKFPLWTSPFYKPSAFGSIWNRSYLNLNIVDIRFHSHRWHSCRTC